VGVTLASPPPPATGAGAAPAKGGATGKPAEMVSTGMHSGGLPAEYPLAYTLRRCARAFTACTEAKALCSGCVHIQFKL